MSTVKITELAELTHLNSNTDLTLVVGVDIQSDITGKVTATTLAEGLYAHNVLNVGNNAIVFPDVIGQFVSEGTNYLQVNLQNTNGDASSDWIATSDNGTDTTNFIDVGINGSTFNDSNYSSMKANDGYVVVQGDEGQPGGNIIVGTATTDTQIKFVVGGLTLDNIVGSITSSGAHFPNIDGAIAANLTTARAYTDTANAYLQSISLNNSSLTLANNWLQANDAATLSASKTYTNFAFSKANSAFDQANTAIGDFNTLNSQVGTLTSLTMAIGNTANAALANTTGTFAGNLTVDGTINIGNTSFEYMESASPAVFMVSSDTDIGLNSNNNVWYFGTDGSTGIPGDVHVSGIVSLDAQLVMSNVNYLPTESALTISASPSIATPAADGYMIHVSGKNGVPSKIVTDSYGTGSYSVYASRTARGNVSHPAAVQTGDIVGRFSGGGYGTTKFQPFGTSRIDFVAAENYTDANTGSQITFWNCPIGSNTLTNIATFNGLSAIFTGVVNPQKGFIYNTRITDGNQTAITIDYASDSMIKTDMIADLTISHTNFTAGKAVELWLVNAAGSSRTVTHGLSALNSTTNSTTFNIPGTSCAHIRFFSIDGDLANTFVKVTHA